jgi:hypothetical protein
MFDMLHRALFLHSARVPSCGFADAKQLLGIISIFLYKRFDGMGTARGMYNQRGAGGSHP